MLEAFGERQRELLQLLLQHKAGLTLDELADSLGIARTAVRQHVMALERSGLVGPGDLRQTGGRPGRYYVLTEQGVELFPKQYSWFSALMLQAVRRERGSDGLSLWLQALANDIANSLSAGAELTPAAVAQAMNTLGYQATAEPAGITAINCVFHQLATEFPEVCDFDRALLAGLTGQAISQPACMAKGDACCQFQLKRA